MTFATVRVQARAEKEVIAGVKERGMGEPSNSPAKRQRDIDDENDGEG